MQKKKRRIIVTALSDAMSCFYEEARHKNVFYPIAMPNLGYGSPDYKGTEAEYYKSIAWLIERAEEEGSRVLILGFGPRSVPSSWIKAAELIIQATDVEKVLIPMCKLLGDKSERDPYVVGTIFHVDAAGLREAEPFGTLRSSLFLEQLANEAKKILGLVSEDALASV